MDESPLRIFCRNANETAGDMVEQDVCAALSTVFRAFSFSACRISYIMAKVPETILLVAAIMVTHKSICRLIYKRFFRCYKNATLSIVRYFERIEPM